MAKKVRVTFKGDIKREFEIEKINIIPISNNNRGPSFFEFRKTHENKYMLIATNDILPGIDFLDRIEILEE